MYVSVVVFLCFLLTISTAFEYKLSHKFVYIDPITRQTCPENWQNKINQYTNQSDFETSATVVRPDEMVAMPTYEYDDITTIPNDDDDAAVSTWFNDTTATDDVTCEKVSVGFWMTFPLRTLYGFNRNICVRKMRLYVLGGTFSSGGSFLETFNDLSNKHTSFKHTNTLIEKKTVFMLAKRMSQFK